MGDDDYRTIRYEVGEGIATLTLDRPDHMNAFTVRMCLEMIDALDRIDADPSVRAVIVTGSGRAFCAGADLAGGAEAFDPAGSAASGAAQELRADRQAGDGATDADGVAALSPGERAVRRPIDPRRDFGGLLTLRIFEVTKPVIAAINGPAVGIGATMTLPMDLRLASGGAKFGFVFAARGIVPEACSSWFLPRLVGIQQALEWCYTARVFPAAEAHEAGLVRSLHEPDELLPAAQELAQQIASASAPVSVALTRQLMWKGLVADHPMEAHRRDSPGVTSTGAGADAREGITAFFEKRPPRWRQEVPGDLPDWFPWWDQPSFDA
ncbi:crotonase/enoyl-CoA hydratase family protein [Dermatobacter hominis]|uniref:crotonase/enoyl-CoA hydratase family protein n=1 Tax=Dermatobacter hominis TaxID=2884263 RepID=UPI001D0F5722|nr:crotonase/enoyl-CoA hydratase family protein [Dermatobacter hominis]UDY35629.1 crotonase/enoyl-CoA hydratase family protein [Dermatobacter hominis]